MPHEILQIIQKYRINAFSKLPYMRFQAQRLHEENIRKIINHHFKHSIPLTANIILTHKHQKLHRSLIAPGLITRNHPLIKLRDFMTNNNYTIVRADKTPQLCIITQQVYDDSVLLHLNDTSTYDVISENRHRAINKVVNKIILQLQKSMGSKSLINIDYKDRKFRILFKLQKEPKDWISYPSVPKTRPIVSDSNSITAKATRAILPSLQKIEFASEYVCRSSLDIVNSITMINKTTHKRTIFITTADVEAMYTNINMNLVIDILNKPQYDISNKEELLRILQKLLRYTTFIYREKIYLQKRGLAMGNPLSGSLANIYLAYFEQLILPKYKENIILYKRYIDDVLILSYDQILTEQMVSEIANISNLRLTINTSKQRNVFLDLMIVQTADNSLITYPSYKYASPIRRSFLNNENRECKVIISQLLRLWRNTNSSLHFTQIIKLVIKYLLMQNCPTRCIEPIYAFLRPTLTVDGIYSHTHKLCTDCLSISVDGIDVVKSIEIKNRTMSSKQPLTCKQKPIVSLIKQGSEWKLVKDTSIHTLILNGKEKEVTAILPLGFMNLNKITAFIDKHGHLFHTDITITEKAEYPCYIFPVIRRPKRVYGIPTARHRLRTIQEFLRKQ
jgi:hypothetical protein